MKSDKIIQLARRPFLTITEDGKVKGYIAVDSIISIIRKNDNETVLTCSDKSKIFLTDSLTSIRLKLER